MNCRSKLCPSSLTSQFTAHNPPKRKQAKNSSVHQKRGSWFFAGKGGKDLAVRVDRVVLERRPRGPFGSTWHEIEEINEEIPSLWPGHSRARERAPSCHHHEGNPNKPPFLSRRKLSDPPLKSHPLPHQPTLSQKRPSWPSSSPTQSPL